MFKLFCLDTTILFGCAQAGNLLPNLLNTRFSELNVNDGWIAVNEFGSKLPVLRHLLHIWVFVLEKLLQLQAESN